MGSTLWGRGSSGTTGFGGASSPPPATCGGFGATTGTGVADSVSSLTSILLITSLPKHSNFKTRLFRPSDRDFCTVVSWSRLWYDVLIQNTKLHRKYSEAIKRNNYAYWGNNRDMVFRMQAPTSRPRALIRKAWNELRFNSFDFSWSSISGSIPAS